MKILKIEKVKLDSPKQFYDVINCLPYHNFIIKTNKSNIVSHNCNFGVGNDVEKKKEKQKKMIAQIDARMVSRFGKGNFLPTLNIIASSKDTEQAFLESYIDTKKKNDSKSTLIIDEPQWIVRNDKGTPNDPGSFWVAVGGKFLAHELLPVDATDELVDSFRAKGYQMLKIPPIYREDFETNLEQALMDDAGISTSSATKYISGIRLNQAKVDTYQNPFTKDVIEVGNSPEDHYQYANFFDTSTVSAEDKARPMFIHLDMSTGAGGRGDKTGIAGVWITGKQPTTADNPDISRDLRFKLAFSVSIKAPKGYQISFEKNRNFIRWLRDQGFAIKGISSDTFQSATLLQELKSDGFNTEIISVDRVDATSRTCLPYHFLQSAIYERKIEIYKKCDQLTNELVGLERKADGHIDHTPDGINCLSGDTKISLVDGRELTMLELLDEFRNGKINYVYSVNENTLKIEPKPIINVFKSGTAKKLLKITLDNNESILCTPEHKFMLRNGSYCMAKDLIHNDSLMPLYRKYPTEVVTRKDYRMYYEPAEDKWRYEHRQFATDILDEKYLVHHKNCNKKDNSPTNLLWCSKAAHIQIHNELQTGAQSPEANAKRKLSITKWHAAHKNDFLQNNYNIGARQQSKDRHAKIRQEIIEIFNINYDELTDNEKQSYAIKLARLKDPTYQDRVSKAVSTNHKLGKYKNAEKALQKNNTQLKQLKRLFPKIDTTKFKELFGFDYTEVDKTHTGIWTNRYRQKMYELYNHRVKSIESIELPIDVYDLTIADNHNFALTAGVFVHNSKDQADAVCGATYLASKFAEEYAYQYGDNLQAGLDVSVKNETDDYRKQQMMVDFEEELAKINMWTDMGQPPTKQQKEELQRYVDIADGIIVL